MSNSFDFEQFKANAIEQLKAGVPLSGKDGVLAPLLENLLNSALEGEIDTAIWKAVNASLATVYLQRP